MTASRSIRGGLGHPGPLLIDGIAALVVFGVMAAAFISARHTVAGQHPATPLAWILAVGTVAPLLTHRRFPLTSLAVCLTAVLIYLTGRFGTFPVQVFVLPVLVLTFDIALHGRSRVALAALFVSAAAITVSFTLRQHGPVFLPPGLRANWASWWPGWPAGTCATAGPGGQSWRPGPNGSSASARNRPAGR
jgi:hypothetical protein